MVSGIPLKSKIGLAELIKISPFKQVIKPTIPHKHAGYFELIVLSDGAGEHIIDDRPYEVTPPEAFFLKPGQTHCWNFTKIPKGYVLLFKEQLLATEQLSTVYQLGTHFELSDDNYLPLLNVFYQEYCRREVSVEILAGYLRLLLQKTAALVDRSSKTTGDTLYYQFKALLHNTQPGVRKVQDFASQLNISTHQLNAVCQKAAGKSPSAMLNERLLMEAKILLSHSEQTIKEITYILCFTDTSHFIKFFKSATNFTPGAYRKLLFQQN